jgi:transposase
VTNRLGHGKQGALVAMIQGTGSEKVISALEKIPRSLRLKVKEIALDWSPTMRLIAKRAFPNATSVADRFHVQHLMNDAISDLRAD